ncbi:hypothetical protein V5F49_04045 [Xanthobacter sp. V3C-3]|uniref:hypothetical protein n=1 Tax=Xanthobacter lutulentifluminis TaxID=3119935 RepID=UPI0037265CF7
MSASIGSPHIEVDYHETEEAFGIVYNLGRFSLEWNMIEHFFSCLIWQYIGDMEIGSAITSGMGNVSKADVLLALARQRPDNDELIERIEFACRAFNSLRESRNILIHSHSIYPNIGDKPHWRRSTGKGREKHSSVEADMADLEQLVADTCSLGLFIVALMPAIKPFSDDVPAHGLPEIFPMPHKLKAVAADKAEETGAKPGKPPRRGKQKKYGSSPPK